MTHKAARRHPRPVLPWRSAMVGAVGAAVLGATPALAETTAETAYIFNTLLFLIGGFLVMLMAAGFSMLEAGMVRTKHSAAICLKNIGLYSIAGLMFYLVGYQFMYGLTDTGFFSAWMGVPSIWGPSEVVGPDGLVLDASGVPVTDPNYLSDPDYEAPTYALASDWFFQMVFVATAASIVSGAVAERIKLFAFFAFVAVLTAVIYPIAGSWHWGGGWLQQMTAEDGSGLANFADFAGSTVVHSVGGWAALAGVLLLGPRRGRYVDGKPVDLPGSSLPLATLGTFVLWFGWFGFNGASQLALGSSVDAVAISQIFANTNMAAAGGVVTAILLTKLLHGKIALGFVLNGALAGLVAITAEPLTPTVLEAVLIGAMGAVIATFGLILLEKVGVDDVVGAIPVHLFAGIWGTLAVPLTNGDASFITQAIGVVAYGVFAFGTSFAVFLLMRIAFGIRLSPEEEDRGGDLTELGHEAYPEFVPTARAPAE